MIPSKEIEFPSGVTLSREARALSCPAPDSSDVIEEPRAARSQIKQHSESFSSIITQARVIAAIRERHAVTRDNSPNGDFESDCPG